MPSLSSETRNKYNAVEGKESQEIEGVIQEIDMYEGRKAIYPGKRTSKRTSGGFSGGLAMGEQKERRRWRLVRL
jgi:hypothetical protein